MRRTYLGRPTTRRILRLPNFSRVISLNLLLVMVAVLWVACSGGGDSETPEVVSIDGPAPSGIPAEDQFRPFTNVALELGSQALIENRYPGVAIFDFDRDGDLDFYVTSAEINALLEVTRGDANKMFRNDGHANFTEVAALVGVALPESNSSAVAACDFNNDGFQDLYVGAMGRIGDKLDYRSVNESDGLADVIRDRLLLNLGNGTFRDITISAFGSSVNIRSAGSIACADVDNDGWIDIYVGNRADQDFVRFDDPRHHGHFNVLYRNNGDLTFTDVTVEAGLLSPPIVMRDFDGNPITFPDPTGAAVEGFDSALVDSAGNIVGDPAGQTWATLFFDHDDDGDADLWVADDGDRLKVYRNDSTPGVIRFTSIGAAMGIDLSGAWMGFALGDYDRDADLDIFVTNMGFHTLARPQPIPPGGDCTYSAQFDWGTCAHFLLQNNGTRDSGGLGTIGDFSDVAAETGIDPSRVLPAGGLDPSFYAPEWDVPVGLAAYDFGFGTTFFDMENDGDQDLYWLGALIARGEGPGGMFAPGFGRMLQNIAPGEFKDVTVEARLVDAVDVDYSIIDPDNPSFDRLRQRLGPEFHENGKGLAQGDLDGDGYVDLIGTNSNGESLDSSGNRFITSGPLFVWLNGGGGNNWATLRLKGRMGEDGTGSNADAIGARVFIESVGFDGESVTQVQDVLGSSSFLSMSSLDLNFGLGEAEQIDKLIIRWPSGVVQELSGLKANQVHEILEPRS
ncbi:MAG: CRTAC1 family protein [Chloroflexi bacterium]|nr:CRTAC1 family protein [Chloroflexota bacterium]